DGLHEGQLLFRIPEIAVPVDGPPVPVGIVKQEIAEETDAHRFDRIDYVRPPALDGRLAEPFTPARPPREDLLPGAGTLQPVLHFPDRGDLGLTETGRIVGAVVAQELCRVEVAPARVVDDAVFQAVH